MAQNFFKIRNGINLGSLSADPASGIAGDFYYSTSTNNLRFFNGTQWLSVGTASGVGQVTYIDSTSTSKPSSTPYSPDGTAVANGDIVLFTNLSASNNQAYQASISGSSITWTIQALGQNPSGSPHIGDLIYVESGSINANQVYSYNGAQWVLFEAPQSNDVKNYFSYQGGNPYFANGSYAPWTGASTTISSNVPTTAPAVLTLGGTNINLGVTTTNPISALNSKYNAQLITPSGSGVQGQMMLSPKFTLDRGDMGQVISGSFNYEISSGASNFNASGINGSESIAVWIYNVNAGTWVQPNNYLGINQTSGVGRIDFSFQSDSTATSNNVYQIALICATTQTTAFTMNLSSFFLGRRSIALGAAMSDWQSYSMTIGAATTAPTLAGTIVNDARWRRVGDSMEITVNVSQTGTASSAAGSGDYLFPIPSGYSIDTTKIDSGTSSVLAEGVCYVDSNGNLATGTVQVYDSTHLILYAALYRTSGGSASALNSYIGSSALQVGDYTWSASFTIKVPILGWSSNVQMSSSLPTGVVAFQAQGTSTTLGASGANATISWTTKVTDTVNGFNGSTTYTAQTSGYYDVDVSISPQLPGTGSYTATSSLNLLKNGSALISANAPFATSAGNGNYQPISISAKAIKLNAGDTLQLQANQNSSASGISIQNAIWSIAMLPNTSTVLVNPYQAPQVTTYTSGSGTYNVPNGALWLEVEMVGGGAGGSGSGTSNSGSAGNGASSSTFDTLTAGGAAASGKFVGGAGGSPTVGSGWTDMGSTNGGEGTGVGNGSSSAAGGMGAPGPWGGNGAGGNTGSIGTSATGYGAGGGGAGAPSGNTSAGGGGSAGAYVHAMRSSLGTSYTYSVGTSGGGGGAGTSGSAGGSGAGGIIIVTAHFQ